MNNQATSAHAEAGSDHWWFAARREILQSIADHCLIGREYPGIVEIGCSVGHNSLICRNSETYHGVDPCSHAIGLAQVQYPDQHFLTGTTGDVIVDELLAEADVVLLTDVLEHVEADQQFLNSVIERMRMDAYLLLTVPAGQHLWSQHDQSLGHYRRYETATLRRLFDGLPVTPRLFSHFNSRLYLPIRSVRWLNGWCRSVSGSGDTDMGTVSYPLNSMLRRIFAGEKHRLLNVLIGRQCGYRHGVSLIAVLQKTGVNSSP